MNCIPFKNGSTKISITDVFDVIESGEEESVKFFNNWTKEAKACVPKERLLEFEVKEGWGPLCKFLNLPGKIDWQQLILQVP